MSGMSMRVLGAAVLLLLGLGIAGLAIEQRYSERKLLQERERKLGAVQWDSLPLQWAITTVRGTGRRKIAVLSDPNCRYCRTLEENLAKLDDITVHILPYAVLGPASERQARAVWCAKDRAKAWDDLMFRRIEPLAAPDCVAPIAELAQFGWRIGARGTPTWFLVSGERFTGAMPLGELRRLLDEAPAASDAPRRRP
jgi:thiol:disulfide interchange protein DsbC